MTPYHEQLKNCNLNWLPPQKGIHKIYTRNHKISKLSKHLTSPPLVIDNTWYTTCSQVIDHNHKFTTSKRHPISMSQQNHKSKIINDDDHAWAERWHRILEWNGAEATMLVHPTKSVKAASGQEHPQAATKHPPLCRGQRPKSGMSSSCAALVELVPTASLNSTPKSRPACAVGYTSSTTHS
jgi:hypothetical protein